MGRPLPDSITLEGCALPRLSKTTLALVPFGAGEILSSAVLQNPFLSQIFFKHKLDAVPEDLVVRDEWVHFSIPGQGEVIAAPVRSRTLELFLRELTLYASSRESNLDASLAERLKRKSEERTVAFLPLYATPTHSLSQGLTLSTSDLSRAFGMRSHPRELRAFRFSASNFKSEGAQYSSAIESPLAAEGRVETPRTAEAFMSEALASIQLTPATGQESNNRHIAALSPGLQGALYRTLYSHREGELRDASPFNIPPEVLQYASPEALVELCTSGARAEEKLSPYHVAWEWCIAADSLQPERTLFCEVRFHTKIAESLGDVIPCYVVQLTLRDKGSSAETFTLLDSASEPEAVAELSRRGLTVELCSSRVGPSLIGVTSKTMAKAKRESLWFAREAKMLEGFPEKLADLETERLLTNLIRKASHFSRRPELAEINSPSLQSIQHETTLFLSRPPTEPDERPRTGPPHKETGHWYEASATMREMYARRPASNQALLGIQRLQVLWEKNQFILLLHPNDSAELDMFEVSWGGECRSHTRMQLGSSITTETLHSPNPLQFERAIVSCKQALLLEVYKTQLAGHTPFAPIGKGTLLNPESPSVIRDFTEALEDAASRGMIGTFTESLDRSLSPQGPSATGAFEIVRVDYNYTQGPHYIERLLYLPGTHFIGGPILEERLLVTKKGDLVSARARLFGRSQTVVLPEPDRAAAERYLGHVAANFHRLGLAL